MAIARIFARNMVGEDGLIQVSAPVFTLLICRIVSELCDTLADTIRELVLTWVHGLCLISDNHLIYYSLPNLPVHQSTDVEEYHVPFYEGGRPYCPNSSRETREPEHAIARRRTTFLKVCAQIPFGSNSLAAEGLH